MTVSSPLPNAPQAPRSGGGLGPLVGMFRLLLNHQLTRGRLVLAATMSGLAVLLAVLLSRETFDPNQQTIENFSVFGLGLMVPILSLVLASSSMGQLVEDETLVYLWIRPNQRWMLAMAAWLASASVAVPLTVLPLTLAAAIGSKGNGTTTMAMALSVALASVAYTAVFTLIGLILRRSLIWGLVYVFIWEFFVARVGQGAARLSINTYATSVLAKLTDVELPLAERSLFYGVTTPIVVSIVAVGLTAWRLGRTNVA